MVCLKAWVRRGLATPPKAISLPPGYDLDWFAETLGNVDQAPWNDDAKPGTGLRIANTGAAHLGRQQRRKRQVDAQREEQSQNSSDPAISMVSDGYTPVNNAVSDAQNVLNIRKDLSHLAKWSGPASAEAVSLARAIEITMNTLIGSMNFASIGSDSCSLLPVQLLSTMLLLVQLLRFILPVILIPPFNIHLPAMMLPSPSTSPLTPVMADGKWKAFANEYEAVLSLWLSSVKDDKQRTAKMPKFGPRSEDKANREDDARLRMEDSKRELGLRLLGSHTTALLQDLRWWVPKYLLRIFEIQEHEQPQESQEQRYNQKNDQGHIVEMEAHAVIGYGQQKNSIRFSRKDLPNKATDDDGDEFTEDDSVKDAWTKPVLAIESYSSMAMLFAQHIFSAFMYAVAGTNEKEEFFQDVADVQPNTSGESTWKSFTLRNATLSAMILEIEPSGLGSLADIYLSVIPPLSENHRLPQADDAIIEMAREKAKQHEQLHQWEEAARTYIWLFQKEKTFKGRDMLTKAAAVLVEYLRQVSSAIDLRAGDLGNSLEPLNDAKNIIDKELNISTDRQALLSLMVVYAKQGREWKCAAINEQDGLTSAKKNSKLPTEFNFTTLHERAQKNRRVYPYGTRRPNPNVKDIHHWTPLHYASRIRSSHSVGDLLHGGADVNSIDLTCNGCTPSHYACQFSMELDRDPDDRKRIIDNLLRESADVNCQGRDGKTPLHYASMEGNDSIASVLIEAGANLDVTDTLGNTPLLWAVRNGGLAITQNLWVISNKRLRDNYGRTALHLAALSGAVNVPEWLITKDEADKEAWDRAKYRPLHWAAQNGHEEIADLLINKGVVKDAKSSTGYTPLHCATVNGYTRIIALLLKHGVRINDKCDQGSTVLHDAAFGGHGEAVALILQQGADKDAQYETEALWSFYQNWNSQTIRITPLHEAASQGHEKVVALLLQHGADPDAGGEHGKTPLHTASEKGFEKVVALLIQFGADLESRTWHDPTPLHKAIKKGRENIVKLLIGHQADINATGLDSDGWFGYPGHSRLLMPLQWAEAYGHANITRILMDAGAKTDVSDQYGPVDFESLFRQFRNRSDVNE
ncbi:hypothetical protein GCG54_00011175 [Colletotrichum gloeosporioides]|uniref:Uncharacterized protein n=1 Tax=Colletotrichum gloeosporioides TaxID=474922 RepID=A0A8H4FNQ4_COLGL|nr:uncharacterized protein GCG54_00011175 [Colletotrichum gloeosporioides]KAF3808983.1 hypothetical protein GCG54_00011175 [Colletotrichum gloeosporioides]